MREKKKQGVAYSYNNKWNKDNYEERFSKWQDYRQWTTNVINRALQINESIKGGTVAILGAGNCDDIDLQYLSNQFRSIYLFDIDEEALDRGIGKYNINSSCTINKITDIEFTGLQSIGFFEKIKELLINDDPIHIIKKEIAENLKYLELYKHDQKYKDMFDLVISMPVYTQIGSAILGHEMMSYCKNPEYFLELYKQLKPEYEQLDNFATDKYNDLIMMLAKEDGQILIFSDFAEFKAENMRDVLPIIPHLQTGNTLAIMELCQDNIVSGANEGFLNIFNRVKDKNNMYIYHWMWPFSEDKVYIVRGVNINKKDCL